MNMICGIFRIIIYKVIYGTTITMMHFKLILIFFSFNFTFAQSPSNFDTINYYENSGIVGLFIDTTLFSKGESIFSNKNFPIEKYKNIFKTNCILENMCGDTSKNVFLFIRLI